MCIIKPFKVSFKVCSINSSFRDTVSAPVAIAFTLQPHTCDRKETTHTFRRRTLHSDVSVHTLHDSQ